MPLYFAALIHVEISFFQPYERLLANIIWRHHEGVDGTHIQPRPLTFVARGGGAPAVAAAVKMEAQAPVSEARKAPSFPWSDDLVSKFVELLVAHQLRYGRNQPFRWKEITDDFAHRTGKHCNCQALRNKYENMKREYKAWKTLKLNETGIGWDPVTGRIDATDEWWERKIKEDVQCKKFRTKGMNPAYEELLVRLFEGQVATGRLAFSPSMHPSLLAKRYAGKSPLGTVDPTDQQPSVELESDPVEAGDEYIRSFVGAGAGTEGNDEFDPSPGPCQSQHVSIRCSPDPRGRQSEGPHIRFSPDPSPGHSSKKTCSFCKRRRPRQSIGSSKLDEHMEKSRSNAERLVSILQHAFESPKKSSSIDTQVSEVVDAMHEMVENGYIDDHSAEYYFGTSMAADPQYRQVFLSIHDAEHRVGWLRFEMSRRALKRKR